MSNFFIETFFGTVKSFNFGGLVDKMFSVRFFRTKENL